MEIFKTSGVCSRTIEFEVDGDIVTNVKFNGGCAGNTQGVSKLAKGRKIDELIELLEGTQCRNGTSCPDQFARALKEYKQNHK
ncbi:MAG: TIGR03905 family TSCPD domain-containing protein [Clostridia bacterium]|nr:TIGR03905 family TSCPD domain-containing protein [Clostridia bacterium]